MKRYPPFIVFAVLALVTIPTRVPEASRTLTPTPPTQECAPPFYSLEAVLTCYLPMHVAEAESRLGTSPPVSPIGAVSQTVGLTLSKVIVEQSQRQYYYHPSLAFGIAYLFGRFPGDVGPGCLPPPPPAYVFVVEHVGRPELQPGVGLGQATYTTTNTKTGATYHTACLWQLEAALPGRGLLLEVSSNLGYEAVEGIGARILGRSLRCGAPYQSNADNRHIDCS